MTVVNIDVNINQAEKLLTYCSRLKFFNEKQCVKGLNKALFVWLLDHTVAKSFFLYLEGAHEQDIGHHINYHYRLLMERFFVNICLQYFQVSLPKYCVVELRLTV